MADVIEKFRRGPEFTKAPKRRLWSLALTGLGGLIVAGMIGLQVVLFAQSLGAQPRQSTEDSTLDLRPALRAGVSKGDVAATGSLSPMTPGRAGADGRLDWVTWFATMGIGLACGGLVYLSLIKLVPAASGRPEAFDTSTSRRRPHNVEDTAEDRRFQGGPIRN